MKYTNCKVSVIILTYKKFDNLKSCVASVIKQKFKDYEIIISDDGTPGFSTEKIYQLLLGFNTDDIRIISHKNNLGTVKNFNHAVSVSLGDIVVPLSQDDCFFDSNVLCSIVDSFEDNNTNICLGIREKRETGERLPNANQLKIMRKANFKMLWYRNACANMYFGAALSYRKTFLLENELFDESYVLLEDYPMVMKCIEKKHRIRIITRPLIYYGVSGVSCKSKNKHSAVMSKDNSLINKKLYEKSKSIMNSWICRRFLLYKYELWKKNICSLKVNPYRNVLIDMFIVLTKVYSTISRKDIIDCRFSVLWLFEKMSCWK